MTAVSLPLPRTGAPTQKLAQPVKVLMGLALGALAVSVVARAFIGLHSSLWLDETWTGAFASEKTLSAATWQIRNDINAPLYYYVMLLWTKVFGLSDLALRIPSLLFSLAAPIVAWSSLRSRLPAIALIWASVLALWVPGLELSGYARCYALLVLLGTINAGAYWRALETPTVGRAAIWVATASLAVLTHYHAAFLAAAEAIIFLALHRRRALAAWPAALAAAPAFAWIAYQAPVIVKFSQPGVAWYDRLTVSRLPDVVGYLTDSPAGLLLIVAALLAALLLGGRLRDKAKAEDGGSGALWLVGLAAVLGAVACLAVAMVSASFTDRYLTPFVPGVLLLVACAVDRLGRGRWEPPAFLIAGFAGLTCMWMIQTGSGDRLYNFEQASAFIAKARPDKLAFFWDHPATPKQEPRQLAQVGGFFLHRAGLSTTVVPVYPAADADMSRAALRAAGPHGAILWLYDTGVHGTRARTDPPRIAQEDPSFVCRNFGAGSIGVVACRKADAS